MLLWCFSSQTFLKKLHCAFSCISTGSNHPFFRKAIWLSSYYIFFYFPLTVFVLVYLTSSGLFHFPLFSAIVLRLFFQSFPPSSKVTFAQLFTVSLFWSKALNCNSNICLVALYIFYRKFLLGWFNAPTACVIGISDRNLFLLKKKKTLWGKEGYQDLPIIFTKKGQIH